ncbi:MAG: TadE/TadG family type IV pilus assembly protein, partial [Ktedonobacterales bacterium]
MWGIVRHASRSGCQRDLTSRQAHLSARRLRQAQRGQALVEFALIFPVILLLVVGATDVST